MQMSRKGVVMPSDTTEERRERFEGRKRKRVGERNLIDVVGKRLRPPGGLVDMI